MLALLLGASSFRRSPKLAQGRAFYDSAQDFHEYLTSSGGLGLPRTNVNWLFDDTRSPSDQLQDIGDFLENRSAVLKQEGLQPQDLIVYYVGHGLFWGPDHNYCLAVRATDERNDGLTSIRVSDLASILKVSARFLRKFLILDCCFSAAAYKEFQSGPLSAGRTKLLTELPQRGTTLLCSASAQDPSLAPEGLSRTMFSDSLLRALRLGHPLLGSRLSLSELGDLVKTNVREAYPNNWVRPEVHSPDQREGDVASIPLFPNSAYLDPGAKTEKVARENAEAQRTREEDEKWERTQSERTAREAEQARQKDDVQRTREETEKRERAQGVLHRWKVAALISALLVFILATIGANKLSMLRRWVGGDRSAVQSQKEQVQVESAPKGASSQSSSASSGVSPVASPAEGNAVQSQRDYPSAGPSSKSSARSPNVSKPGPKSTKGSHVALVIPASTKWETAVESDHNRCDITLSTGKDEEKDWFKRFRVLVTNTYATQPVEIVVDMWVRADIYGMPIASRNEVCSFYGEMKGYLTVGDKTFNGRVSATIGCDCKTTPCSPGSAEQNLDFIDGNGQAAVKKFVELLTTNNTATFTTTNGPRPGESIEIPLINLPQALAVCPLIPSRR
jgi:hypothetical protein